MTCIRRLFAMLYLTRHEHSSGIVIAERIPDPNNRNARGFARFTCQLIQLLA